MRLLGIDYGKKRVGLALSDESGRMAFPYRVLKNDAALLTELSQIIAAEAVREIIIGHSKSRSGEDNVIQAAITELMTDLTLATGLPVHLEPEQYSTQEAIRIQGRTKELDASAAAIILNSFITRKK